METMTIDPKKLPHWAKKPHSHKNVIATDRGWMIESTGEYLLRVRNLRQRLDELYGVEEKEEVKPVVVNDPVGFMTGETVVEKQQTPVSPEQSKEEESKPTVAPEQPAKRGRGRPRQKKE